MLQNIDERRFLTASDVGRRLERSVDTVRRWAKTGRLRCISTESGVRLFEVRDVEAMAAHLGAPVVTSRGQSG